MTTITVSSKYEVVIPVEVRERLKVRPGQKFTVVEKDGVVHLIPIRPLRALKGSAEGTTDEAFRDEGDER